MNILTFILCIILLIAVAYLFIHFAFGQQFQNPGDQFNQPGFGNDQFGNNQQFGNQFQGNQGFDQNQQFGNQFGQNQFQQQPYGQQYGGYGTPTYGPQYQQPYNQQYGQIGGGFDIQQIIGMIIAGGGSAAYTRRKTNSLEKDNQQLYSEVLKGKQVDAEIARITMQMNQEKANQINDAPLVKLENLQKDVEQFTDKTAKA